MARELGLAVFQGFSEDYDHILKYHVLDQNTNLLSFLIH